MWDLRSPVKQCSAMWSRVFVDSKWTYRSLGLLIKCSWKTCCLVFVDTLGIVNSLFVFAMINKTISFFLFFDILFCQRNGHPKALARVQIIFVWKRYNPRSSVCFFGFVNGISMSFIVNCFSSVEMNFSMRSTTYCGTESDQHKGQPFFLADSHNRLFLFNVEPLGSVIFIGCLYKKKVQ